MSPRLHARASLELYRSALAICENFITLPHGGIRKRGGTYFAGETKASAVERPVPFIFSEVQAYCLFFGNLYFRVYAYGGPVMNGPSIVEVVTPYTADEIADLQFKQSGDVLYVTHPDHEPQKIARTSNTAWSITEAVIEDGPFGLENVDKTHTMYASAATGAITLTASDETFTPEMIGQLVRIKVETYETWPPWEAGGFLTKVDVTLDVIQRRYNGNVYLAVEPTATTGKIFMGGTPPTHLEGTEWDGKSARYEDFEDGDAAFVHDYGVKWQYLHSGFGVARITAVALDGLSADATVEETFPDELVGSGNASYRWSVGGFGGTSGFPRSVTIFDERLMFGQRFSVYGSKSFDFTDFRAGSADADAVSYQFAGTSDITWLQESDGFLVIGTIGGVRTLSGGGNNENLTPTSFKNRASPTKRCSSIPPVKAGSTFIYVGFDRKSVVELNFSLERNGYQTPSLSLISEHIPKTGIVSICHQSEPDSVFWMGLENGEAAGLTYEQDQQVRGWHRHRLGGAFEEQNWGIIEWAATTPGQNGGDDLWLVVKRSIDGATRRYIEVMQTPFEYGDVEDAFMVDCGLTYEGAATNSVSGLTHLIGQTVVALADGRVFRDLVVNGSGVVTLPGGFTAAKVHVGLPYTAVAETLELDAGGRDGSVLGRRKRVTSAILSVLESANIYVKALGRNGFQAQKAGRNTIALPSDTVSLYTGNFDPVMLDDSWEGRGKLRIEAPDPVPATIRAILPQFDSESG